MGDSEIIALFFQRSQQAIAELDVQYGSACRQLSFRIVNDRQDAEECVNDAYLGIWNAIPPAKPSPLLTFLLKIVRNISLSCYWRKKAAKRQSGYTMVLEELEECIPYKDTVEQELEAKELAGYLERFLDTLSAENRAIFVRRYWLAQSYGEISACMGIPEKTISVRLTRIRGKMKKFLLERGVFCD